MGAGPADLAAAWAKRRHAAGGNVRAQLVDAVRRKAELAVDRAISLPVRMLLATSRGSPAWRSSATSIDEAVLRSANGPCRPYGRGWPTSSCVPRRRLSFPASSFSLLSAPWLGTMQYLHDVCGLHTPSQALAGVWATCTQRLLDPAARSTSAG